MTNLENLDFVKKNIFFIIHFLLCFFIKNVYSNELVESARSQIGKTLIYDGSYVSLNYPNGDVDIEKGVCTDVLIRAMRKAYNIDLQKEIHIDMKNNFSKYPKVWKLKKPDKNIDHRRVLNIKVYLKRKGYSLPVEKKSENFIAGDIVACIVPPNLPHIMIVSDKKIKNNKDEMIPLVIHNIGNGTQEENSLFDFELTGHYRLKNLK